MKGQKNLWPLRSTLPLWRALLDAGNDVWVDTAVVFAAWGGRSRGSMSTLLHRWKGRGWLEHRVVPSDDLPQGATQWRLTFNGRIQVRLMIEDDDRERAVMESVHRREDNPHLRGN